MDYKCQNVALSQIDISDTSYRISTGEVLPALVQSIKEQGVVNPPILIAGEHRFTIVTGFARIMAARQVGLEKIPSLLMASDAEEEACARIAVIDNAMHRELSLIEQASAIGLLTQRNTDDGDLVQTARACGLAVNSDMVRKLRSVIQMSPLLRQGLADGAIALPIALQLHEMVDHAQSEALVRLLIELRLGLNRQREIFEWIIGIARRNDSTVSTLLQSGELSALRKESDMDRRQKGEAIRQVIKKMRYPAITRHERRYARAIKSLKLEKGTQLIGPHNFEGQVYSLKFDFQSYDELLAKQKELSRLLKSPVLKNLWEDSNQ